ncbi:DEAD/DEAH box helicase [Bacillus massiliigorillae]|uniref:DEAD/DEAH box helicase n=1 Tax=Bacillus massiliigorillae TaxID=1243664 RepID=UPI0003A3AA51|nr:DEAD/DEAH box helicase [Bacillus massiliigorillae]
MNTVTFQTFPLSKEILRALESLQYRTPTEVQSKVIPVALEQQDHVVKSQTGSGKTASYAIPICEMLDWLENKPQALILTPTRELAAQVKEDFTNIGRFKRIKAAAIYGKQSYAKQKLDLKQKTHVVVGTPGRVLDHIEKGTLAVEALKYLVIDESDEMLNMGFIDQVSAIIEQLPKNRMTALFSATLPEDVEHLCTTYMNQPVHIEIKAKGLTTEHINHELYSVEEEEKLSLLRDLTIVEKPDSAIIFCRTQERVNELYKELDLLNYDCDQLHGGMYQEDRFAVMDDFRKGAFRYLVATDVAARGIDIDNITHIFNYDFPVEKESYVHRTGRTGRAGNTGKAISFMTPSEQELVEMTEAYIGFRIPVNEAPTKAEIAESRPAFKEKMDQIPDFKQARNEELNKDITKLYFNGGKKKKIRAVDFVGTIAKIPGVTADDIGIITIQEQASFVEILNGKGDIVLQAMKKTTVKGKVLKVYIAKK